MKEELTTNERYLLAREVAADRYLGDTARQSAARAGWDAAVEYVKANGLPNDQKLPHSAPESD